MAEPDNLDVALQRFTGAEASSLALHESRVCCLRARTWFSAMARAQGRLALQWVSAQWLWGPNAWPLYWCQAVKAPRLDCGGLAALTDVAGREMGLTMIRVQVLIEATSHDVAHWEAMWRRSHLDAPWIVGTVVYHEMNGVKQDGAALRLWDPAEQAWQTQTQRPDGVVRAVRLVPSIQPVDGKWLGVPMISGVWHRLGEPR